MILVVLLILLIGAGILFFQQENKKKEILFHKRHSELAEELENLKHKLKHQESKQPSEANEIEPPTRAFTNQAEGPDLWPYFAPDQGLIRGKVPRAESGLRPGPPALFFPVRQRNLKITSEEYKYPFYFEKLQQPLPSRDFHRPGNFYEVNYSPQIPFFSSVNSFMPSSREINTSWEKTGLLTSLKKDSKEEILNLYRRPIAPLQDLFEYMVQDKNGFVIPLEHETFLENNDIVKFVPGKKGSFKVHIYVNNKWILM